MKHYQTLIKLRQKEIDNLSKQIGNLRQQSAILEGLLTNLQTELMHEVSAASNMVAMGAFFGDYSQSNKQKQQNVREQISKIEQNINLITDKMMLVFADKKKYEIAARRAQEKINYSKARHEQQFLDEMAANRYNKNKEAL